MFNVNNYPIQDPSDTELARVIRDAIENGTQDISDLGHDAAAFYYESAEPKYDVYTAFKLSMGLFAAETVIPRELLTDFVDGVVIGTRRSETLLNEEANEAEDLEDDNNEESSNNEDQDSDSDDSVIEVTPAVEVSIPAVAPEASWENTHPTGAPLSYENLGKDGENQ